MSKRYCKNVDLTDLKTVRPWVMECITRHADRYDFQRMLQDIGGLPRNYKSLCVYDQDRYFQDAITQITQVAIKGIKERKLDLPPVQMERRIDPSSLKERLIGRESPMQQVYDHIAVDASQEILCRRRVPQQASSIKERGQIYGTEMISKWVKADYRAANYASKHDIKYYRKCKYHVKLDAEKCFPSMRMDFFLDKFKKDCANDDLIWLWTELLNSHRVDDYEGFMIGALPSQEAAQYIFSFIYRYAMSLHSKRGTQLVSHMLIFMDDMLLTGPNYKNLKSAVRKIVAYAKKEFGINIKPTWQICDINNTPIDMMGYRVHKNGGVTIRPRVFLRARRIALRANRKGELSNKQAKRFCSYKGYFFLKKRKLDLRSQRIAKKLHLWKLFKYAGKVVGYYERRKRYGSNIFQGTGDGYVYGVA